MRKFTLSALFVLFICFAYSVNRYVPAQYLTIQSALNASSSGDTVFVSPGTYSESIVWPQTDGITLKSMEGLRQTIINPNYSGRCMSFVSPWNNPVITAATVVDGFTLKKGQNSISGAGINCYYASPTLTNCLVIDCRTIQNGTGGGIYCYSSSPLLNDVYFIRNTAYFGGGIYLESSSLPIFSYCVVADNTCNFAGGSHGPGIYAKSGSNFQFNFGTISRNYYQYRPAVHLIENVTPIINNSVITQNLYGFLIAQNAGLIMHNSNLLYNDYGAIWNFDESGGTINLQNNFWGAATGPFHETLNPNGEGDPIVGTADFANWLTDFCLEAPPAPPYYAIPDYYQIGIQELTIIWPDNGEANIDYYEVNWGVSYDDFIQSNDLQVSVPSAVISIPEFHCLYMVRAVNTLNIKGWYCTQQHFIWDNAVDPIQETLALKVMPNPVRQRAEISFALQQKSAISVAVFNLKGQKIKSLYYGMASPDFYNLTWDGRDDQGKAVTNGFYFVRLQNGNQVSGAKLILMK